MRSGPLKVGIVGAGSVNDLYMSTIGSYPDITVQAIADRHPERAQSRSDEFGILPMTIDELLTSDDVEAVLNLTPPASHYDVSMDVLAAGKHLYNEKPLAMTRDEGAAILAAAARHELVVGAAPDITLGRSFRNALRQLAGGLIGDAVFARCEAVLAGPERWHPRPQFLYAHGGGPLFDIGPYYITALVAALGVVDSVSAIGTKMSEFRTIGSGPDVGTAFRVEVPSLTAAHIQFASGVSAQMLLTFDSASHRGGQMEIFGVDGTLRTPDPNGADATALFLPAGSDSWEDLGLSNSPRGIGPGVANFARHIRGTEHLVVSGQRALHVLDVMCAIEEASNSGNTVAVESFFEPTPVLPDAWDPTESTLLYQPSHHALILEGESK
jgi:predicted dehydrogenase